jgi:hypothetical protein
MHAVVESSTTQSTLRGPELLGLSAQNPVPPLGLDYHSTFIAVFVDIANSLRRIAEAHSPSPTDKVGCDYISNKVGLSSIYVAEMARKGKIPTKCIVPGTGNSKPWKFFRKETDDWIASR